MKSIYSHCNICLKKINELVFFWLPNDKCFFLMKMHYIVCSQQIKSNMFLAICLQSYKS